MQQFEPSEYPHQSHSITYFDSAGRSILPSSVEAVGIAAVKQKSQPWNGVGSDEDIQKVRESFASLIGAESTSIALTPSTGFAMTLVAKNVVKSGKLGAGKVVLILDKEMGSAVYPWQEACKQTGATFRVVADPLLAGKASTWTEEVLACIDESVAVVALPAVHWCNGALIDLVAVSNRLALFPKETRPLLVVDGTQSLGALPFNLSTIHADVVACSVHKWLNCPYGLSLLYIHPDLHHWEPLDHHERGREGSNTVGWDETIFMHPETGFYPEALYQDARRFDAGGKANPVTIPMVRAGLQTVHTATPEVVQQHCAVLTDSLATQLDSIFGENVIIRARWQRSAHIFGVRFCSSGVYSNVSLIQLHAELKQENVFVSVRGEWLRVSVYLHNSLSDVNRFVALFVQIVQKLYVQDSSLTCSVVTAVNTDTSNPVISATAAATKRVLITGSAGWLAQFVLHSLLPHTVPNTATTISTNTTYEIYATYSSAVPHWIPNTHRIHLDLSNTTSIYTTITTLRPDIIIHTAAVSSPVVCHKDKHRAYAINCPTALIDVVQECIPDALFVFTSTDMVYDGESAPYSVQNNTTPTTTSTTTSTTTTSEPQPVNVYGATKLAFEKEVMRLRNGNVLRLSNMIGAPYKYNPAGAKFLEWVYGAFSRREFIGLKEQEIRSFVYVQDVVDVILRLMEMYSVVGSGGSVGGGTGSGVGGSEGSGSEGSGSEGSTSGNVSGVCNVGGPAPLSRLDVARGLCSVLGTELNVVTAPSMSVMVKEAPNPSAPWKVYVMDAPTSGSGASTVNITVSGGFLGVSPNNTAIGATLVQVTPGSVPTAVHGELRSPRDISMDSTATAQQLGVVFTPIEDILRESLNAH